MEVNAWSLLGGVLLCAAVVIIFAKIRAWRRARQLAQAEAANRLCRQYCDLILRLKDDPFNVSLCQKFLACALAYYCGNGKQEITVEVEQRIMNDLMLAGVRRSAIFVNLVPTGKVKCEMGLAATSNTSLESGLRRDHSLILPSGSE